MKCEYCNSEHDGNYGSGRFCSIECARGYASRDKREEINKKLSAFFKGKKPVCCNSESNKKGSITRKLNRQKWLLNNDWDELTRSQKKERVFLEQEGKCNICGIKDWLGKKLVLEFHHANGNKEDNSRENVSVICPNCHSQTPNYRFSVFAPKYSKDKVLKNLRK